MSKVNDFFKTYNEKIIILFLFLCPVIDIITSFFVNVFYVDLTLGIVLKTIFGFYMIYYLLFIFKGNKRYLYFYATVLLIYFLLYFYFSAFSFGEVQFIFKVFYFPLSLIFLFITKNDYKFSYKLFSYLFLLYLVFLFIPIVLNMGFESYDIAKSGSVGLFNSANEIGGVLTILFPMFLYNFIKNIKDKRMFFMSIIGLFMYFYTILNIGTKAPVLGFALTIIGFVIYYFYKFIKAKKVRDSIILISSVLLLFMLSIFMIPKTTFYKNILIHMNHFNINSFSEVFTSFENVDNIIFSERLSLLKENYNSFNDNLIFGTSFIEKGFVVKTVEIDYFDILFTFGILGFILFFTPLIYVLYLFIKKKIKFNISYFLSLLLAVILAFFTGHIFIVPTVSFIVSLLICKGGEYEKNNNFKS